VTVIVSSVIVGSLRARPRRGKPRGDCGKVLIRFALDRPNKRQVPRCRHDAGRDHPIS
jgi:hypothetical protein